MVLPISTAKITVDAGGRQWKFDAEWATIGSNDGGRSHFLHTSPLLHMTKNPTLEKEEAPVTEETEHTGAPRKPEQSQALGLVRGKARLIERQRLENAERIQQAHLRAREELNEVNHAFNTVVLAALHEGLSHEEIIEYLQEQKLEGFEESVGYVVDGDFGMLYPEAE